MFATLAVVSSLLSSQPAARQRETEKASTVQVEAPPEATPSIPLLGNALFYKSNPPEFLAQQSIKHGGVFSMNLAGFRVTVLSTPYVMRQFATAPESVLSSAKAVSDFGFLETLGELNVVVGASIHKAILKNHMYEDLRQHPERLLTHIHDAFQRHMPHQTGAFDALTTTRTIILEGLVTLFIGTEVIAQDPRFVQDFMVYQDHVENATAKAITMPRWLANLLVLAPTRRMRLPLVARLTRMVEKCWAEEDAAAGENTEGRWGLWTTKLRGMAKDDSGAPVSAADAAELLVGLLFAGHKNPAIGAAQVLLYLLEHQSDMGRVCDEVRNAFMSANPAAALFKSGTYMEMAIMETLRIVAHSLGAIRKVVSPDGFTVVSETGRRFHIPYGSYVGASHTTPNRDPTVFPQPLVFRPGRFLSVRPDEYSLTTFSHGIHKCPGEMLAYAIIESFLGVALRHYDLRPRGAIPPLDFERATLAQRLRPAIIEYTKRGPWGPK